MIKIFLICDSQGYPFYSRKMDQEFENLDERVLSGMISAIGMLGKKMFNEEIATVTFGVGAATSSIVVVSRELFGQDKSIYFVFFLSGACNHKLVRELAAAIFIETKVELKQPQFASESIKNKVDIIIDHRFNGLSGFCSD
jgi:hypothetical protein